MHRCTHRKLVIAVLLDHICGAASVVPAFFAGNVINLLGHTLAGLCAAQRKQNSLPHQVLKEKLALQASASAAINDLCFVITNHAPALNGFSLQHHQVTTCTT